MATALSTTKRKFHKILDSISNASNTSLVLDCDGNNASKTTLPSSFESAAKKPRVTRPTSAHVPSSVRKLTRQGAGSRDSMTLSPSSKTTPEHKAPNFAPWDRGQFLARLETFRHVDKWMGKPDKINEVEWAKRGWTCVAKERVGCAGGCGKEVVISLESDREEADIATEAGVDDEQGSKESEDEDWREEAQEQLVEKYAEMIVTEHEEGCLWRRRGCDDTIHRLPLAHQTTALNSLRLRYRSLVNMAPDLPSNISTPQSFDITKITENMAPLLHEQPSTLAEDASGCPQVPEQVNLDALTLALFGWQSEADHISGLATCTACFRRLGLWLFKISSASSASSGESTSKASTVDIEASMTRLDVIGEHRDYCPWINQHAQNGDAVSLKLSSSVAANLAGWEILLRVITNAQYTRSEIGIRVAVPNLDGIVSEIGSVSSSTPRAEDRANTDEKDKERWAKLKRLKQVFHVKKGKGKGNAKVTTAATAR